MELPSAASLQLEYILETVKMLLTARVCVAWDGLRSWKTGTKIQPSASCLGPTYLMLGHSVPL